MKKLLFIYIFVLLCFSVFASDFSFKPVNVTPLYPEAVADPYAYTTHVYLTLYPGNGETHLPLRLLLKDDSTGEYQYKDVVWEERSVKQYVSFKCAGEADILNFKYKNIVEVNGVLAGSINSLFSLVGSTPSLGYDGSYFYGGAAKYKDIFSVRFGVHHFSSHYDNEVINKFQELYKYSSSAKVNEQPVEKVTIDGVEYTLGGFIEYVRDNSYLLGVSAKLPLGFRLYSEIEIPKMVGWIRPWIHAPYGYDNPSNKGINNNANGEGVDKEDIDSVVTPVYEAKKNTGYRALRVHGGFEWRFSVKNFGDIVLGYDIQAHQDGQTNHQVGLGKNGYDKSNPWELEHTVAASFQFGTPILGTKTVGLDAIYHYGRAPQLSYFYHRASYVMVGVSIR